MITVNDLKNKVRESNYELDTLTEEEMELFNRLDLLKSHKGKLVKHFKNKIYLIIDIVEHSETGEELVIYKALYGDCKTYARSIDMFLSKVDKTKHPESTQDYRFVFVESR